VKPIYASVNDVLSLCMITAVIALLVGRSKSFASLHFVPSMSSTRASNSQSGTVVVGHPPKNSVDGAGRQRKTSASSTHSGGPVPLLYEEYVHGRM
jgi:hypothetical protein